jgi:hypothetical protein
MTDIDYRAFNQLSQRDVDRLLEQFEQCDGNLTAWWTQLDPAIQWPVAVIILERCYEVIYLKQPGFC